MDWVLDNLDNIIIPIIIMILYGLGSFAQKKDKKEKKPPQQRREQQVDPDESRRVARIQEEIRRKIAERAGRTPPPPPQKSLPASRPVVQPSRPSLKRERMPEHRQKSPEPARRATPPPMVVAPGLQIDKHQQELKAKMRKVRELEAVIKTKPATAGWGAAKRRKIPKDELRTQLFQDLSHPLGQKKAILVGEILGSPVGIKGPAGWKSNV